ncbi:DNA-binding MarR family transcriptional regulator [Paenarthrobacter nicotinovorans]|jgi:DNA-binding MarR family transcriptional regulator|uniref:DNA-binding MarR family transcriptional regulator n=1 Tax=Paenarthrobacter nicotinovorans TaxID=29320 RepID=A0ABT9TPA5_PAENI|nr:MarR family transcriptional regulator [Paenarthrobacter nicotinovorans]SKC06359.1 DNA-binding transcriptional regulator, MarR family [Arthrobacter sp. 31Cvi3.1E]BCW12492.1 MarR family transcriptional regulator [Arthrobacter sp. NtRootA2]BCW16575.1 MarR family transcriptional regulator [Arthrobacter sp. NtRootA4]BCW24908.1 MarR family transcriptional regulator [Arthrobacter sp. NtRootC7]BCW29177.1 MarR family transcriptional regulator [Arthrobacter sp. NtRootC45]BCW33447.1 MarR family trans
MNGSPDSRLTDLAQDFREALRLGVYMFRRLDPEGELTAAQLSLLSMISDGGLRVGDIAKNLGIKVPSATEQIIKLERAGLVTRRPDPDDSRAVQVAITDAGTAAVESANQRRNAMVAELLQGLSAQEIEQLAAALPVISKINSSFQN